MIAANLAKNIITKRRIHAAVIVLEGELGAGKTTFAQGFARALNVKNAIKSPTFLIMREYKITTRSKLFHIDCFRVKNSNDLTPLGIEQIMSNPHNIVLIEWPERIRDIIPKNNIRVHFDHISEHERKITITP